jgi:hypothetical protein
MVASRVFLVCPTPGYDKDLLSLRNVKSNDSYHGDAQQPYKFTTFSLRRLHRRARTQPKPSTTTTTNVARSEICCQTFSPAMLVSFLPPFARRTHFSDLNHNRMSSPFIYVYKYTHRDRVQVQCSVSFIINIVVLLHIHRFYFCHRKSLTTTTTMPSTLHYI